MLTLWSEIANIFDPLDLWQSEVRMLRLSVLVVVGLAVDERDENTFHYLSIDVTRL